MFAIVINKTISCGRGNLESRIFVLAGFSEKVRISAFSRAILFSLQETLNRETIWKQKPQDYTQWITDLSTRWLSKWFYTCSCLIQKPTKLRGSSAIHNEREKFKKPKFTGETQKIRISCKSSSTSAVQLKR
uniref:Uncharacterized protein n=1 Tax=Micrurus lemniscatus lemniscatus TaxID=129467 RepID=A0A2D4JK25_MICLE